MRILIVEDEIDLCDTIAEGLSIDGYAVDKCYNGLDAYEILSTESYDLVILDLNLPLMDGIEVLQKTRLHNKDVKIIILSARSDVSDKVLGLDMGANDYLAKPFAFEELEARIRSLLRRCFIQENTLLEYGTLSLNTLSRSVSANGEEFSLTKKELSILEYFLLNRDKVISQEELIQHIWDNDVDIFSNSIRVHIASLRKKLKNAIGKDIIQTKIGQGYHLVGGKIDV